MDRLFSKLQLGSLRAPERSAPSMGGTAEPTDLDPGTSEAALLGTAANNPAPPNGERPDTTADQPEDPVLTTTTAYRPGYGDLGPAPRGELLKVSSRSRPSAVAGAIAGVVREVGRAEVQAIGAGAVNQAVKAVAIARDYLRETNIEAICLPGLVNLTIEDADRTAVRLVIEPR